MMAPKSYLRVLIMGSGPREHAIAWKLCQSKTVEHVYIVPGNAGTAMLGKATNITNVRVTDFAGLVLLAKELGIGLVVPGAVQYFVDDIEGYFRGTGIACFACTKEAAQLEVSKPFAKDFMIRHDIPTAQYQSFTAAGVKAAKDYILKAPYPVVVKAAGLAGGRGSIIPSSKEEALQAVDDILVHQKFGPEAGSSVVIEEYLEGTEVSILTLSDYNGHTWTFPTLQDHKRMHDGDIGPNTGGLGAYGPTPFVTPSLMKEIEKSIVQPALEGLLFEGLKFVGCLYTGLMLTSSGPRVLEFNVRFGEPEMQSMVLLLDDETDFAEVLLACINGTLDQVHIDTIPGFACNVVMTGEGYPDPDLDHGGEVIEMKETVSSKKS
ncbi:Bifunctional purine biosynthetic protein ADE1 [Daldinia childiae]|uniref:Bifunctional purine biosynthetic protein ADE1 n=1 Tax=Daldinia childiae TaxID=326645 RepID=UPI0014480B42|nr:Bifunctional purine biosynthetic protein ADE1 [Daldinia childiae]KAF3057143.1 Bifunctional purine biosynthetic protein ADE1 [Daldinia childiae]